MFFVNSRFENSPKVIDSGSLLKGDRFILVNFKMVSQKYKTEYEYGGTSFVILFCSA